MNRSIPIIADDFVDRENWPAWITGAHGFQRLRLLAAAQPAADHHFHARRPRQRTGPKAYRGMDVSRGRVLGTWVQGLPRAVPHKHMVPVCERTGQIVEPMLTDQWFVAHQQADGEDEKSRRRAGSGEEGRHPLLPRTLGADHKPLAGEHPGLVHLAPALVGHQIPAWYDADGKFMSHAARPMH